MFPRITIALLFATLLSLSSADAKVSFNNDIRPLLSNTCFRCHGPDPEDREANLRLDTYEGATADHKGTRAVVPGDLDASELIYRITTDDPDDLMPPPKKGKQFTAAQIELFKQWIKEGANYETHWSYTQPARSKVPVISDQKSKVRNPIDAFLLDRLSKEKLTYSPETDRRTLIRRISLDLTGLPPTPEEVAAFVADKSPDAYEKVAARLLASSAFGEHWARMWLDLARYADSAGYADDPPRTIWAYRDWVIRALNDNMPFDQFSIEQLAGDLLENPTQSQLVATAFHRNTQTNSEGGTNDEEFRNVAVADRVNTTMATWMGTTMACAQCHTHKYDPITHEDYFKMFAILNQTEDADRKNESPTIPVTAEATRGKRSTLEAEIASIEKAVVAPGPKDLTALAKWEAGLKTGQTRWQVLSPNQMTATSGASFKLGSDKSVLVSGKSAGTDSYTIAASTTLRHVTAVKIEALAYDKLGSGGPGRNGNFVLNEIALSAGNPAVAAKFSAASSSFDQPKFGAAAAIDGNKGANSGWAVGGALGKDHHAIFELANPLSGGALSFVLDQTYPNHGIGRFRISVTDSQQPAAGPPAEIAKILATPKAKRDAAATGKLFAYFSSRDPASAGQRNKLAELKKQLAALKPGTTVPVMRDLPEAKHRKTHIQLRGSYLSKGDEVTAGVPTLFGPLPEGNIPNRLGLAKWLVSDKNPLTARVVANRFWEQIFGVGIVLTSEEFGSQGEAPSHPELLDWLAVEFVEGGWDMKRFLALLVTSTAYRQGSHVSDQMAERDPANRLLARGPRVRLSAEMVRDQALAASGLLSRKMYGAPVRPPQPNLGLKAAFGGSVDWKTSTGEDKFRRALYTNWRRSSPYPSMATFDAPNREVCTVRRGTTNTPLQALVTLNDPVYIEAAQSLARRMAAVGGSAGDQIAHGFLICTSRAPNATEIARLVKLFTSLRERYAADTGLAKSMATVPIGAAPAGADLADLAALTVVGNVLLNLDEMLMKR